MPVFNKQTMSKFNAATRCLLLLLLSVIFVGCAEKRISVTKGDFEVAFPYTFSGVGKELPKNTSIRSVTLVTKYTNDKTVPLENLYGDNPKDADLSYIIEQFPVSLEYSKISKLESKIYGFTIGLSPYPYTEFIYGYNGKHIETGVSAYIGVDCAHKANYTYTASYEELGIGIGSYYDDEGTKSTSLWHIKIATGGFVSGYWSHFALTYSPMVYQPYALHKGLPAGEGHTATNYDPIFFLSVFHQELLGNILLVFESY